MSRVFYQILGGALALLLVIVLGIAIVLSFSRENQIDQASRECKSIVMEIEKRKVKTGKLPEGLPQLTSRKYRWSYIHSGNGDEKWTISVRITGRGVVFYDSQSESIFYDYDDGTKPELIERIGKN